MNLCDDIDTQRKQTLFVDHAKTLKRSNENSNIHTRTQSKFQRDATSVIPSNHFGSEEDFPESDEHFKRPRKVKMKESLPSPRTHVNQALTLQTETNNLLKHIVSQNDKMIQLMEDYLKK